MSYGRPYRTLEGRTEGKLGRREREGHHYTSRRESHHQRLCADQVGITNKILNDSFRCAPPRTAHPISWEQPRFTKNAASTRVQATEGEQGRAGRRGGGGRSRNGPPALSSSPSKQPVQRQPAQEQWQGGARVRLRKQSQSSNRSHRAQGTATMGKALVFN